MTGNKALRLIFEDPQGAVSATLGGGGLSATTSFNVVPAAPGILCVWE
jgi:hypothetical protein